MLQLIRQIWFSAHQRLEFQAQSNLLQAEFSMMIGMVISLRSRHESLSSYAVVDFSIILEQKKPGIAGLCAFANSKNICSISEIL